MDLWKCSAFDGRVELSVEDTRICNNIASMLGCSVAAVGEA